MLVGARWRGISRSTTSGHAWGIYVRETAVFELAAYLLEAMPEGRRFDPDVVLGAVRTGLGVLYLHEAFHHRMESFAIGIETVEQTKIYCPYHDRVFKPLRAQGSDDLLEEALATAESYRRLHEDVYRRSIPADLRKAARHASSRPGSPACLLDTVELVSSFRTARSNRRCISCAARSTKQKSYPTELQRSGA